MFVTQITWLQYGQVFFCPEARLPGPLPTARPSAPAEGLRGLAPNADTGPLPMKPGINKSDFSFVYTHPILRAGVLQNSAGVL